MRVPKSKKEAEQLNIILDVYIEQDGYAERKDIKPNLGINDVFELNRLKNMFLESISESGITQMLMDGTAININQNISDFKTDGGFDKIFNDNYSNTNKVKESENLENEIKILQKDNLELSVAYQKETNNLKSENLRLDTRYKKHRLWWILITVILSFGFGLLGWLIRSAGITLQNTLVLP